MIEKLIWALIFATLISIIFYITRKEFFEKHKGFAEFLAVMVSLIFSLIALQQAQSSIDQSTDDFNQLISKIDTIVTNVGTATNSVDSVKMSLVDLPQHIDTFSYTIESLNSSLSGQKETIETTLNNLSKSVKDFQLSVDAMTERYNRKPELVLDFKPEISDTMLIIPKLVLKNEGNLAAELSSIAIKVPTQNVIEFDVPGIEHNQFSAEISRYSTSLFEQLLVTDPTKTFVVEGGMKFRLKPDFLITIIVYYKASFGNDGFKEFHIAVMGGNVHLLK